MAAVVNGPDPPFVHYRRRPDRSMLMVDVRGYRRRVNTWLIADRVYVRGRWTPLVRLRVRRPRASDGGTEW